MASESEIQNEELTPQQALFDVCRNEKFDEYRLFETALGIAARAILAGDDSLVFEEILGWDASARQRAGYLLQLLYGWAEPEVYDRHYLFTEKLYAVTSKKFTVIPFFYTDRPGGFDDVAKIWGLTRGADIMRLRKMLEPPYLV